jgi:hypothetical protein
MRRLRENPAYRAREKLYRVDYRDANRERLRQQDREYKKRLSRPKVLSRYGLDEASYHALLSSQGGTCAICGGTPNGRWGRFCVDHDHRTKSIRGILCNSCNGGLAFFRDCTDLLLAARRYLERSQSTRR